MASKIATGALLAFVYPSYADLIVLKTGSEVRGKLTGWNAGYISISIGRTGESVERRVRQEEVASLQFHDEQQQEEAIGLLHLEEHEKATIPLHDLAIRRATYLGLLDAEQERWLITYMRTCLKARKEEQILHYAKLWQPKIRSESHLNSVSELKIRSALNLGRLEEAALYADYWIESGLSSKNTAIAWIALAKKAFREEEFQDALWLSLQPIAFSNALAPHDMGQSYAIAIKSAKSLDQISYSNILYEEMLERHIQWPENEQQIDFTVSSEKRKATRPWSAMFSQTESSAVKSKSFNSVKRLVGHP